MRLTKQGQEYKIVNYSEERGVTKDSDLKTVYITECQGEVTCTGPDVSAVFVLSHSLLFLSETIPILVLIYTPISYICLASIF